MKNKSLLYSVSVLVVSWGFTLLLFQNEEQALKSFALVMFAPLVVAIIFNRIPALKLTSEVRFFNFKGLKLPSWLFGLFYPIVMVLVIAVMNLSFGISDLKDLSSSDVKKLVTVISTFIPALLSAFGEEAGWRGYLLPSLAEKYSNIKATFITGVVWATFHMPVVYLLAKVQHVPNPALVTLVQAGTAFTISFSFAYIFFKTRSLIPVILLHASWNLFNPYVLGNIYTNETGILKGNLFIQNGEGVMGLIVLLIACIFFRYRIKQLETTQGQAGNIGPSV
ncbi:type II CAAX endopeptidase family protein [Neobacillus sp. PS2-9]|uniref:CPBP family intramembrane glutamic endopeptidase n=1 Tax=Neobacillus sp. PS2-9 TaxID=3070676 RepID=UPI0027E034A9|nr:type II CAAX endopeptidase family protein [Neobacillus sp. PS2-9]WML56283.1 type II CAAX endopeptidase family protein [Neobacillus sp. PS2-9]